MCWERFYNRKKLEWDFLHLLFYYILTQFSLVLEFTLELFLFMPNLRTLLYITFSLFSSCFNKSKYVICIQTIKLGRSDHPLNLHSSFSLLIFLCQKRQLCHFFSFFYFSISDQEAALLYYVMFLLSPNTDVAVLEIKLVL